MTKPFISKPSDLLVLVILGSLAFVMWYAMVRGGRSKTAEEDGGCGYLVVGFVFVVILGAIGIVLISGFQAIYPGQ